MIRRREKILVLGTAILVSVSLYQLYVASTLYVGAYETLARVDLEVLSVKLTTERNETGSIVSAVIEVNITIVNFGEHVAVVQSLDTVRTTGIALNGRALLYYTPKLLFPNEEVPPSGSSRLTLRFATSPQYDLALIEEAMDSGSLVWTLPFTLKISVHSKQAYLDHSVQFVESLGET